MAVRFSTSDGRSLLSKFNAAIDQREKKGKIETWVKLEDGIHYTHASDQWKGEAFFRASLETSGLAFYIVKNRIRDISVPVYGYYHGHLIETFSNHFDTSFSVGSATARPAPGDIVS